MGACHGQSPIDIPDEDRNRFVQQAREEGLTLSAWLKAAARKRLEDRQRSELFESPEDMKKFFMACDTLEGPEVEPEWDEHLRAINESQWRNVAKLMGKSV